MLKISFLNILLCLLTKYVVFFILLAFIDNRFKTLVIDTAQDGQGIFINSIQYILHVLIFSFVLSLIFSAPLYYSFKTNNIIYFLLIIIGYLVAEYFVYTYLASPKDLTTGVYNGIISIAFLLFFFYKPISSIFR